MTLHHRVLDLTDERGQTASQMLNWLGADVVLVEPPAGSRVRRMRPFAGDVDDGEHSLTFWGWNRGKRGVVLDLDSPDGQAELLALACCSDVVIESGAVPVDLDRMREANPALVTVSISAFGSTGPKAAWPATDLTVLAAGGQLALTGDADRPPVRTSVPQAFLHAAGDAACGALVALAERATSGRGQHVDISAQRSVLMATQSHVLAAPYGAGLFHRMSGGHSTDGIDVRMVWPCKDGHALVMLLFGPSFGPYTARLMAWIRELGLCTDTLADDDWTSYGERLFSGNVPIEGYEQVKASVGEFCAAHTKDQLLDAALTRRLLIAPVVTTAELASNIQLAYRGSWETVSDPALSAAPIRAPGPFIRTAADRTRSMRAPRLGEHGSSDDVLAGWPTMAQPPGTAGSARRSPLEGLRVIDLTWALSGPATARFLSDFGATVVHIESSHRVDAARTVQPYFHDIPAGENAAVYHNMNVGKLSMSLNLGCDEGRAVLDDLIISADVLIESFSPRGRRSLGLDYDRLAAINPRLVMMSSCLFGQDGPLSAYAGFGNMAAAMTGFFELTGWADRAPAGPFSAYTDYVSPRFAVAAILTALEERHSTRRGQYLDFAQAEAALHFLVPAILDETVNGRSGRRHGNDDDEMAPHGVYPCAGEDRWIAIACRNDDDWRALAGALGRDDLADIDGPARRTRRAELDLIVAAWTASHPAGALEALLIDLGVPAHVVQHSPECAEDPQLRHQGHLVLVEHPEHGTLTVEASRVDLSVTPSEFVRGAPTLGLHTIEVLTDLLGYDDDRVGALFACGALD